MDMITRMMKQKAAELYDRDKDLSTGKKLENDLLESQGIVPHGIMPNSPQDLREKTKPTPGIRKASQKQDEQEGTDFLYENEDYYPDLIIRLDTTADFSKKDNMPFIADTKIPAFEDGPTFKIGIRHGNNCKHRGGYSEFESPVCVIGFDCPDGAIYNANRVDIRDTLRIKFDTLMEQCVTCLDEYMLAADTEITNTEKQSQVQYIQKHQDIKLHKNKSYKPHSNISQRVQDTIDFVNNMIETDTSLKSEYLT